MVTGTNMCVLVCAMIIASVGLNVGSTAVIIGAMLISPIMGSILASAYGLVSADYPLLKKHLIGFGIQIVISVTASMIYFFLSPVKEASSELLARTSPTFFDVLIAFFGGLAGIISFVVRTLLLPYARIPSCTSPMRRYFIMCVRTVRLFPLFSDIFP